MNEKQIMNKILEFYKETRGEDIDGLEFSYIVEELIEYYSSAGFEVNNISDLVKLVLGQPYQELLLLNV